jgi:predicted transcriptional regulator
VNDVSGTRNECAAPAVEATLPGREDEAWSFLSLHGRMLVLVVREPGVTVEALARGLQVSRRTAFRLLQEIERAGYLRRGRRGRRNIYEVDGLRPLRHRLTRHRDVGELLALMVR